MPPAPQTQPAGPSGERLLDCKACCVRGALHPPPQKDKARASVLCARPLRGRSLAGWVCTAAALHLLALALRRLT